MKLPVAATLLSAALAAQSVAGWTLTYDEPRGRTIIHHGRGNKPCTPLYYTRAGGSLDLQRARSRGCCFEVWTGNMHCQGVRPPVCRERVTTTTSGPSSFRVYGCTS